MILSYAFGIGLAGTDAIEIPGRVVLWSLPPSERQVLYTTLIIRRLTRTGNQLQVVDSSTDRKVLVRKDEPRERRANPLTPRCLSQQVMLQLFGNLLEIRTQRWQFLGFHRTTKPGRRFGTPQSRQPFLVE